MAKFIVFEETGEPRAPRHDDYYEHAEGVWRATCNHNSLNRAVIYRRLPDAEVLALQAKVAKQLRADLEYSRETWRAVDVAELSALLKDCGEAKPADNEKED